MFVVMWRGPQFQVHYQQEIGPREHENRYSWLKRAEWSWGPGDGSFLVPCSEAHALALISAPRHCLVIEGGRIPHGDD